MTRKPDRALLLMRHCKSDWGREDPDDFSRPLSRRGRRDARRIAAFLGRSDLRPDLIIASPAARARRTAEIIADRCGYRGSIAWEQVLYGTDPACYLDVLTMLPEDVSTPLIIGHNPAVEQTVRLLAGGHVRMQTGAVACLGPGTEMAPLYRWAEPGPGRYTLRWLVAPGMLQTMR